MRPGGMRPGGMRHGALAAAIAPALRLARGQVPVPFGSMLLAVREQLQDDGGIAVGRRLPDQAQAEDLPDGNPALDLPPAEHCHHEE